MQERIRRALISVYDKEGNFVTPFGQPPDGWPSNRYLSKKDLDDIYDLMCKDEKCFIEALVQHVGSRAIPVEWLENAEYAPPVHAEDSREHIDSLKGRIAAARKKTMSLMKKGPGRPKGSTNRPKPAPTPDPSVTRVEAEIG